MIGNTDDGSPLPGNPVFSVKLLVKLSGVSLPEDILATSKSYKISAEDLPSASPLLMFERSCNFSTWSSSSENVQCGKLRIFLALRFFVKSISCENI